MTQINGADGTRSMSQLAITKNAHIATILWGSRVTPEISSEISTNNLCVDP
jgi:hypothetical protein